MAILQGILALLTRSIGRVLNTRLRPDRKADAAPDRLAA
jgi:hypothetical protein